MIVNAGLREFVHRLELHSRLSHDEQQALYSLDFRELRLLPKRDIVKVGQAVHYAHIVTTGTLGRFEVTEDGSRQITAIHFPGECCDLQSIVLPRKGCGLTNLGGVAAALQLSLESLRRLSQRYPSIAFAFWRESTLDAALLARRLTNVGRQDGMGRVAHFLCEFGVRSEQAKRGTRVAYPLDLSQEQIGDALGLTAVHVNRLLRLLRINGIATVFGQAVKVLDWDRLSNLGEFSATLPLVELTSSDPEIPPTGTGGGG